MKKNDIFERTFDGNTFRFQLTELKPRWVAIRELDSTAQINKECKAFIFAPSAPGKNLTFSIGDIVIKYKTNSENIEEFASLDNGEWVTTQKGDKMIENLTVEIYNRIKNNT